MVPAGCGQKTEHCSQSLNTVMASLMECGKHFTPMRNSSMKPPIFIAGNMAMKDTIMKIVN